MAMTISELIERAREEISKLTNLELSTTLGAAKDEKGWHVSLELIEKHSIPDQMDILSIYDVWLDDDGNLLEFKRRGLRKRIDIEETEAE
ncbi:gas vesicle protein [Patescibacteria group bacterium]|nr:gas vesicle protein [Patescibacteria group bacterium]